MVGLDSAICCVWMENMEMLLESRGENFMDPFAADGDSLLKTEMGHTRRQDAHNDVSDMPWVCPQFAWQQFPRNCCHTILQRFKTF
jgi:hypothetical protein